MSENQGLTPKEENQIVEKQVMKDLGKDVAKSIDAEGTPVEKVVVIRHDNPKQELTLRDRLFFEASGNIDTVSRYLDKRSHLVDHEQTTVFVDREAMQIEIQSNETDYFGDKLSGALKVHPDFKKFGINTGNFVPTQKLGDFFKMHRAFFVDRDENFKVVSVLKNFEGSVDAKIKEIKQDNGNTHVSRETIVNSTIPPTVRLRMGLFKGLEPKEFDVNLVLSVSTTGQVVVNLESPDAQEIIETYKNEVIDKELEIIDSIAPAILIIEK